VNNKIPNLSTYLLPIQLIYLLYTMHLINISNTIYFKQTFYVTISYLCNENRKPKTKHFFPLFSSRQLPKIKIKIYFLNFFEHLRHVRTDAARPCGRMSPSAQGERGGRGEPGRVRGREVKRTRLCPHGRIIASARTPPCFQTEAKETQGEKYFFTFMFF
jgi:hypothetical protein